MDAKEFARCGKDMVEYIANYIDTIDERLPLPDVTPGYLRPLIPDRAPEHGESYEEIKKDIDRVILPGVTHWHSPHFHAYFPVANSFPALLGTMISDGIGCVGFSWKSSPANTELEVNVIDWLANMLNLPEEFKFSSGGPGGGLIQGSASESTLMSVLGARSKMIEKQLKKHPCLTKGLILDKLVAYTSEQCHSSIERASMMGLVTMRKLVGDEHGCLRGETLQKAINKDLKLGLIPFYVGASIGTTAMCAFDNIAELGPICEKYDIWMHIDAAYAGSACICPEFRHILNGVEYATSFMFSPHKWLLTNFDCTTMWIKDRHLLTDAFYMDPVYLKHENQGGLMPDFRHWQIPMGRRFRSLKLWFVLRSYGVSGLQEHIRKHVGFAEHFCKLVESDPRFEVVGPQNLGLVCFRIKGANALSETLKKKMDDDRRVHLVPAKWRDVFFLRFVVCARTTELKHINYDWDVIQELTDQIFSTDVSELTNGHSVNSKEAELTNGHSVEGTKSLKTSEMTNGHSANATKAEVTNGCSVSSKKRSKIAEMTNGHIVEGVKS